MAQKDLIDFSEELKKLRIEKDISLEKVHGETKIDLRFLQAIESADFDIMPQVYIRAFIKEYAKTLGLDPETIVKKYDSAKMGISYESKQTEEISPIEENKKGDSLIDSGFVEESHEVKDVEQPVPPKFSIVYILAGLAGIILIALIYFFFIRNDTETILVEKPYEAIMEETKERYEIPEEKKNIEKQIPQDSLRLEIRVTETSWFKVISDNKKETEFILQPNRTKVIYAKEEFNVIIGNSGGVNFSLDDKDLEFYGRAGQVRKIKITPDGIVPFQPSQPAETNE